MNGERAIKGGENYELLESRHVFYFKSLPGVCWVLNRCLLNE